MSSLVNLEYKSQAEGATPMAKQGKHERKDQPASTEGQSPSGKSPESQRPRYQVERSHIMERKKLRTWETSAE